MFHGVRTYILQSSAGQIVETHSISAGLDYPGVGPEHAWLKDSGRAEYVVATDEQALRGFRMCTQLEGIIPGTSRSLCEGRNALMWVITVALESSHAVWEAVRLAKTLPKEAHIVVVRPSSSRIAYGSQFCSQCLSGRGDKDVEQISQLLPGKWEDILDWHITS